MQKFVDVVIILSFFVKFCLQNKIAATEAELARFKQKLKEQEEEKQRQAAAKKKLKKIFIRKCFGFSARNFDAKMLKIVPNACFFVKFSKIQFRFRFESQATLLQNESDLWRQKLKKNF